MGVEPEASFSEIRKAFRLLALRHHPDRNAENSVSPVQFIAITEAYRILSDPDKRRKYHQRHYTTAYRKEEEILKPATVYNDLLRLKDLIYKADPYRLNKEAVVVDLNSILPGRLVYSIAGENLAFKSAFTEAFEACAHVLSMESYREQMKKLHPLAEGSKEIEQYIAGKMVEKNKIATWEKYKVAIAVLVALALCAIIYFAVL